MVKFFSLQRFVLIKCEVDFSICKSVSVKESSEQNGPLQDKHCQHEIESNRSVTVSLEKSHQESETDENHHMNILKH